VETNTRGLGNAMTNVEFRLVGLDTDGCLICEDTQTGEQYNCGETPAEFGIHNILPSDTFKWKPLHDTE
jgi:hypothetical protein